MHLEVKMKKTFLLMSATAVAVTFAAGTASSQTYTKYGNTIYGSNGSSFTKYGNTTYGNNGSSFTRYGNTVYGSNGSSMTKYGNSWYKN